LIIDEHNFWRFMEMIIGKLLYALVGKNMLLSTNKGRWTTYSINTAYRQGVTENSRSKGCNLGRRKVATSSTKGCNLGSRKVATSLTNCLITLLITFFKKIFLFEVFCIDNIKR